MLKSKFILFACWVLFLLNPLKSETTYGWCYLQDAPNGANLAELEGDVYLMTMPDVPNFMRVLVTCWVYNKDFYDDLRLNKKVKLYNNLGKKIGVTVTDFNPFVFLIQNDSTQQIQIAGYLSNTSINPQSVPENNLSELLLNATNNAQFDYFKQHINAFNYLFAQEENNYTSYTIFEPDFVKQVLNPRILMVFYKNELIAVFHTRSVKVKHYDSIEMGNAYKMIYNSKFTEHTKTQMMQIYKQKLNQLK